jgi:outer membrane protein assembly factor BamB
MARMTQGRLVVVAVAVVLACAGCDWFNVGANSAHTGYNPLERSINADTFPTLHRVWSAAVQPSSVNAVPSSVAVAGGNVFVHSSTGQLQAYDVAGSEDCSGTPTVCMPRWTGNAGAAGTAPVQSDPATDGSTVFVGGSDGTLYAFDAQGVQGCSGSPTTCAPLWTAALGSAAYDPVVDGGRVYVGTFGGGLFAFDASGTTNCAGTPLRCAPLWSATPGTAYGSIGNLPAPAVTSAFVYYPGSDGLGAYDPAGQNGCGGTPVVCTPRWTADFGGRLALGWPVVAGGIVYQSVSSDTPDRILAIDAAGVRGCSGSPVVCAPLWSDAPMTASVTPAVGPDGMLYAGFSALDQFSTDGTTGCGGTPTVCLPLHDVHLGSSSLTLAPSLTDDLVLLGVWNANGPASINAYRQGTLASEGAKTVGPGTTNQFPGKIVVANGKVFLTSSRGDLQAWTVDG